MPLTLIGPAFADGERLPDKYARPDRNLSPPLRWSGVPEKARALALLMDDPDAPGGVFHHWLVCDMAPGRTGLAESVETGPDRGGLRVAPNDFDNRHYDGPEPPEGDPPHRHRFRLVALDDATPDRPAQVGARRLREDMAKHVIEEAALTATWSR